MLTLTALTLNGVVAASVLQTSVIDTVPEVSHATGGQVMESSPEILAQLVVSHNVTVAEPVTESPAALEQLSVIFLLVGLA